MSLDHNVDAFHVGVTSYTRPALSLRPPAGGSLMFWRDDDDDGRDWSDIIEGIKADSSRSQDDECDFCGSSEGSVIVNREESHPDVGGSPPVVRCKECFNDPETYHDG